MTRVDRLQLFFLQNKVELMVFRTRSSTIVIDLENQRPAIAAADEAVKRLIAQGVEDPAEGERQ